MSGRARLGAAGPKAPAVRREDLDDNVLTYRMEADGRAAEERVLLMPIERIEASPFQVRRYFPEGEIEKLADSIRDHGLVHPPKGRPHPTRTDWVELMPGELRLRALARLIERGEAEAVLKRDGAGNWLAPIAVVQVDDERAEAIVFAENEARTDLSPWEWALAWQQRRDRRAGRGQEATVRAVAAAHGKRHTTVGEYLKVADEITEPVLRAAGVMLDTGVDHAQMATLTFGALKGVAATAASLGTEAAARHLAEELRRARRRADRAQADELSGRRAAAPVKASFQINIRRPLPELSGSQATHYLGRISEAIPALVDRARAEIPEDEAERLARVLEDAARMLRR